MANDALRKGKFVTVYQFDKATNGWKQTTNWLGLPEGTVDYSGGSLAYTENAPYLESNPTLVNSQSELFSIDANVESVDGVKVRYVEFNARGIPKSGTPDSKDDFWMTLVQGSGNGADVTYTHKAESAETPANWLQISVEGILLPGNAYEKEHIPGSLQTAMTTQTDTSGIWCVAQAI